MRSLIDINSNIKLININTLVLGPCHVFSQDATQEKLSVTLFPYSFQRSSGGLPGAGKAWLWMSPLLLLLFGLITRLVIHSMIKKCWARDWSTGSTIAVIQQWTSLPFIPLCCLSFYPDTYRSLAVEVGLLLSCWSSFTIHTSVSLPAKHQPYVLISLVSYLFLTGGKAVRWVLTLCIVAFAVTVAVATLLTSLNMRNKSTQGSGYEIVAFVLISVDARLRRSELFLWVIVSLHRPLAKSINRYQNVLYSGVHAGGQCLWTF